MDNPLSWDYLTTIPGPNEVLGPFAVAFVIACALGFVMSVILYNGYGRKLFPNPVLFRFARKWGGIGVIAFGLGLFFFLIRAVQINPFTFGMRIWLWLSLLGILAMVGYIIREYVTRYPAEMVTFNEQQRRNQYIRPGSSTVSGKGGSQAIPIGARPVKRRRRS